MHKNKIIACAMICSLFMSQVTYAKAAETNENAKINNRPVISDVRLQDDFYNAVNKDWLNNAVIKDGQVLAGTSLEIVDNLNNQKKELINDLIANKNNYSNDSNERKIINLYENSLNM